MMEWSSGNVWLKIVFSLLIFETFTTCYPVGTLAALRNGEYAKRARGYHYADHDGSQAGEMYPDHEPVEDFRAKEGLIRSARHDRIEALREIRERNRRLPHYSRSDLNEYDGLVKGSYLKRTSKESPDHKWHFANMAVWG